jgi:hypothetical protein
MEVVRFDAEFDNANAIGVVAAVDEPGAEVEGARNGASEVALRDDRVLRIAARLPAVVSFVMEVL